MNPFNRKILMRNAHIQLQTNFRCNCQTNICVEIIVDLQ